MRKLLVLAGVVCLSSAVMAQQAPASGYLLPPKVIVDMLDAPPPPTAEVSPTRDAMALLERASMPTIAELVAADVAPRRRAHQPAHQRAASRAGGIAT